VQACRQAATDEALVASARAGDRAAFAELVTRHHRLLVGLCERGLGDAGLAEDAAQEAILQALLGLDGLRRPARFGPWLAGIGLNVCRRWLRARAGEGLSLDSVLGGRRVHEAVEGLVPDPAWAAEEHELAARVRQAVRALPPGQREAVVVFYLLGSTHAATAAALGIPVGAVKTRLHKARANLRRELWTLWEEMQPMSSATTTRDTSTEYVEVHVLDVRRVLPNERFTIARHVVLLQETGESRRVLGVWVGAFESEAILILLSGVEVQRPLTFTFASRLVEATGARLREVRIQRLVDETFFAETVIQAPDGQERLVDARPSDAIALALASGAPIRVAEAVMSEEGQVPSDVEAVLPVDGTRVLGKGEIAQEMERMRVQRDTERQEFVAAHRQRRASRRAPS
jgi:RNA polymerase sigma factor (sigma-70 family)